MSKKYYVVYSSGKLEEVDYKTYKNGFNDPFVTLMTEEIGELTIEQTTEESEHEDFHRSTLGPSKQEDEYRPSHYSHAISSA